MSLRSLAKWFLLFSIQAIQTESATPPLAGDLVAYLVPVGMKRNLEVVVPFTGPSMKYNKLVIRDPRVQIPLLEFDPDFNRLERILLCDVTNDGIDEVVSEWTHGMARQVVVHQLSPEIRAIFHASYRHVFEIHVDPTSLQRSIRIFSSITLDSSPIVETFRWSKLAQQFLRNDIDRRNPIPSCFGIYIPGNRE